MTLLLTRDAVLRLSRRVGNYLILVQHKLKIQQNTPHHAEAAGKFAANDVMMKPEKYVAVQLNPEVPLR